MNSSEEDTQISGRKRAFVIAVDRAVYNFSKHWLAVFNTIAFIYVGLPVLAPILMNAGLTTPARVIYSVYSPMCHQMSHRSFFLGGEQVAYPRQMARTELTPIEAYIDNIPEFDGIDPNNWPVFFAAARNFLGNEQMGYKMALCERDIAIYGFVLVGGLLYAMLRKTMPIKPLPLLVFIFIGLVPIGLDGFSQLFSYWSTPVDGSNPSGILAAVNNVFSLRESTPMIRSATGAWFGLMLVWLAYPHINVGMKSTELDLEAKLKKSGLL